MKYLIIFLFSFPSFCSAQMVYEKVALQQDVVVVNSTANANFQGGDDRIVIPFKLPDFTNGYFLRITVVQKERSIPKEKESPDLISELLSIAKDGSQASSGAALLTKLSTPPVADNIDIFIIDGSENMENFNSKNDDDWSCIYSLKNTVSCNSYFDIIPTQGYICLRNMHWDQGMQVKLELVAEIGWGKSSKQKLYNTCKEELTEMDGATEEQIKSFCGCFIKKLTSKPIAEIKELLDFEIDDLLKSMATECQQFLGTAIDE